MEVAGGTSVMSVSSCSAGARVPQGLRPTQLADSRSSGAGPIRSHRLHEHEFIVADLVCFSLVRVRFSQLRLLLDDWLPHDRTDEV